MKSYKKILVFIVIGFIIFPTVVLGGKFVSSLIQGKSVPEAIETLAEQIEILIGRVDVVETKQTEQEQVILQLQEQNACLEKDVLIQKANSVSVINRGGSTPINELITLHLEEIVRLQNTPLCNPKCGDPDVIDEQIIRLQNIINELEELNKQYLEAESLCNG